MDIAGGMSRWRIDCVDAVGGGSQSPSNPMHGSRKVGGVVVKKEAGWWWCGQECGVGRSAVSRWCCWLHRDILPKAACATAGTAGAGRM